ncbi:MAG: glutamine--fructose-6-phosphate transaminase (isomerizing) [Nitrospirae bacterium]|nr:glutamine--fructose-6-phosphate transaminase (isomerizing) [Nitrospirota bacterium]
MCGIIGYIGNNNSIEIILDGLKRLEYRGYDSAGIAYINKDGHIDLTRCQGKIIELVRKIADKHIDVTMGIGHTRWATHGGPSEKNAHPHRYGKIAIVHNGIIENYITLKKDLMNIGHVFSSDTDTEVICHLINDFYSEGKSFEDSVRLTTKMLVGSYAIAVINESEQGKIICAKMDSPLVIGLGKGEYYVASDVPAFLNYTRDVIFLKDSEFAVLSLDGVMIFDSDGKFVTRASEKITWNPSMAEKGGYRHFMLKEIFEQPRAVADTIGGRINAETGEINILEFGFHDQDSLLQFQKIFIVACGTSWHAALCAKYMIEELARVSVEVDIASEFRYRNPLINKSTLLIAITQSGETADTLAAIREAKKQGAVTLTICNVLGSTASRESDHVFYTHSGPEIGVASTKSFTAQLVALYMLAIALAGNKIEKNTAKSLIKDLLHIPLILEEALSKDKNIEELAKAYSKTCDFLYLGRGILYPIALEGALKLKEISYIHAEGYPAGEMKHGPIALIDEKMPVVILLTKDALYNKVISNIEEVKSRGGNTLVISNEDDPEIRVKSDSFLFIPKSNKFLNALTMSLPLQLLAYHIAVIRGCDVDQPRNLAKSVTVE